MNSRKKYVLLVSLISIVFVFIILTLFDSMNETTKKNHPFFIKAAGNWYSSAESEIPLNILFFDKKNSSIFDNYKGDISIAFDNENIKVLNYNINRGDTYKDIRLYSISITATSNNVGKQLISKIYINNGDEHIFDANIGEFVIYITEPYTYKGIEVIENMASSEEFKEYLFTIKNVDSHPIIVDEILCGEFEKYTEKITLSINGNSISPKDTVILNPGVQLSGCITFNSNLNVPIKFFAPSIIYHNKLIPKYYYNLYYATYGLPLDEITLIDLYDEYKSSL